MSDEMNPFDTADELNPFSQVNDYNPFSNQAQVPGPDAHQVPLNPEFVAPPVHQPPGFYNPDPSGFYGANPGYSATSASPAQTPGSPLVEDDHPFRGVDLDGDTTGLMAADPSGVGFSTTSSGARVTIQEKNKKEESKYSFYQLGYYQEFFNVDSTDVGIRCLRAMWPFKNDFLESVKNNPDFYGPFWITTTLIFMMAASGNLASYLTIEDTTKWHYDILKLTVGTGLIYGYSLVIPLVLWFYFRWLEISVKLIEILCIYGYSLFIYLPVAVLSIIPFSWVKWLLIGIGLVLSTGFLVVNLWMPLRERMGYALLTLGVIGILHAGLALAFRLYFFCYTTTTDWTC